MSQEETKDGNSLNFLQQEIDHRGSDEQMEQILQMSVPFDKTKLLRKLKEKIQSPKE